MDNIFGAAEFYISKGFKVFPVHGVKSNGTCTCNHSDCSSIGKHPACPHGRTDAVGDLKAFRDLVGARENLNIGIATGPESGMWVLDIDGPEGLEALANMQPIQRGAWQSTGKGQHWIFRYPSGVKVVSRTSKLGPKLDVRGEGGYIVAAPSRHKLGHQYQWNDGPLDFAPAWLVEMVSDAPQPLIISPRDELEPFSESDVLDILSHIGPDDSYDNWYQVGMALESGGYGLNIWESWSRKGAKYKGPKDCKKHWGSFKGKGITMGSLVYRAQQNGWRPSHPIDRIPMESHPAAEFIERINKTNTSPSTTIPLHHLTPLIADIINLINSQSVRPQPTLALLNTLTFLGAIFGRRYQTHTGIRTNLYSIGIAPSTIGKDQSRKTIKNILSAVPNLNQINGGDSIISSTGLLTLLGKCPRRIIQLDEIGMYLQTLGSKNAASHDAMITSLLMQLFSTAQSTWTGPQYADAKREQEIIAAPHLCIYGTTTVGAYAKAMNQDGVESGQINRFIVLQGDNTPPFNHDPNTEELPKPIIQAIQHLHESALSICQNILDTQDSKIKNITPHKCEITPQSKKLFQSLFEEQDKHRVKDSLFGPLWGRMAEHAIKIAMINAICRTPSHPVINLEDMELGEAIARQSVAFSIKIAREHMNSGEFHKQCQFVERLIRESSTNGITRSQITLAARTMNMKGQDVGNVLDSLLESDTITPFKDEKLTGRNGIKATRYFITP